MIIYEQAKDKEEFISYFTGFETGPEYCTYCFPSVCGTVNWGMNCLFTSVFGDNSCPILYIPDSYVQFSMNASYNNSTTRCNQLYANRYFLNGSDYGAMKFHMYSSQTSNPYISRRLIFYDNQNCCFDYISISGEYACCITQVAYWYLDRANSCLYIYKSTCDSLCNTTCSYSLTGWNINSIQIKLCTVWNSGSGGSGTGRFTLFWWYKFNNQTAFNKFKRLTCYA